MKVTLPVAHQCLAIATYILEGCTIYLTVMTPQSKTKWFHCGPISDMWRLIENGKFKGQLHFMLGTWFGYKTESLEDKNILFCEQNLEKAKKKLESIVL